MTHDSSAVKQPFPFLPGLGGLLRGELRRWLGRRGLAHLVGWTVFVQLLLFDDTTRSDSGGGLAEWRGFDALIHLWWIATPLAAIAISQNALIEERRNQTASWVLSKPVSRSSFVVAKIVGDSAGLIFFALLLQGALVYAWMPEVTPGEGLPIQRPELTRFLVVVGIHSLIILFFVAMTVCLTTVIPWRGPVAAIGLIVWIVVWTAPRQEIKEYTIGGLVTGDLGDTVSGVYKPITEYLVFEQPLEPTSSVVWTALAALAFTAAGALIFRREQF